MIQRDLVLQSVEYSTELRPAGSVRKARMVFVVKTSGDIHTYSLPLTCIVDEDVSEDDMIAYAKAELHSVINQLGSSNHSR